MVEQFGEFYQKQHENLIVQLYQNLENFSSSKELIKYLSQFKYVICDEAHYWLSDYFNEKNFVSFKAINSFKNVVIFITGTPEYVLAIKKYLKKPLIILRDVNKENNNIRKIYIAKSRKFIDKLTEVRLKQGKKVIEFSRYPLNLMMKSENYKSFNSAFLVSKTNAMHKLVNEKIESEIIKDRDGNNRPISNVSCNWLGCTTAYENGCNFNIEGEVTIIFSSYFTETSLEQCRARVRDFKDTVVDIVVYVPREKELKREKDHYFELIKEIKDYRAEFLEVYGVILDDMLKLHSKFKEGFEETNFLDDYEYNQIRLEALEVQLRQVEKILQQKNKSAYYFQRLKELYPNREVIIGNRTHLVDYDKIIKEFIGEKEECYLDKKQQIRFKKIFIELKVFKTT